MNNNQQIYNINRQLWQTYFKSNNITDPIYQPSSITTLPINTHKRVTLIQYDCIPSTMILSQHWPRQHLSQQDIFCFIAKEQSSGVGQKSNKWVSPIGNTYLTILTKCPTQLLTQLSIRVNNAIVKTLKQFITSAQVKSKWVNDIFVNNKKISGALIKNQILMSTTPTGVTQIGVGVNIKNAPSLEFTCAQEHSLKDIQIQIFNRQLIEALVYSLFHNDSFQECLKIYENNLLYLKQQVTIFNAQLTDKLYQGIFTGINQSGHALVEGNEGVKVISDGRMRQLLRESGVNLNVKQIMKQL